MSELPVCGALSQQPQVTHSGAGGPESAWRPSRWETWAAYCTLLLRARGPDPELGGLAGQRLIRSIRPLTWTCGVGKRGDGDHLAWGLGRGVHCGPSPRSTADSRRDQETRRRGERGRGADLLRSQHLPGRLASGVWVLTCILFPCTPFLVFSQGPDFNKVRTRFLSNTKPY